MNLVVGASGILGGEICRRLAAQGAPLRALIRPTSDPARTEDLKRLGAELVDGDLKDRASLDHACSGVTSVITTATAIGRQQPGDGIQTVDLEGQMQLVDAARAAGVEHFVYISVSRNLDVDSPFIQAKRTVEQHLRQSGLAYTILRPTFFMEGWLSPALGFDVANGTAQIFGAGQNAISWVSLYDVAHYAVEALAHPAARHAILELGGPAALSPLDVVRIGEELSGRQFNVQHVPEEALQAQWEAATDPLQRSFTALMLDYAQGDAIDMREALTTLPVQLTSVSDYIRRLLSD